MDSNTYLQPHYGNDPESCSYAWLLYSAPARPSDVDNPYLRHMDQLLAKAQETAQQDPSDVLAAVFANQAAKHDQSSRHAAGLISERVGLATKHHKEISSKLTEMSEARFLTQLLNPPDGGKQLNNIERMILDLEKQQRDEETHLWKDILELRTTLLEERSEYHATSRRMRFLSGGVYGGG
jgi:hypothetical protein